MRFTIFGCVGKAKGREDDLSACGGPTTSSLGSCRGTSLCVNLSAFTRKGRDGSRRSVMSQVEEISTAAAAADDRPVKQPLDAKTATLALLHCCSAGDAKALRQLFEDCVLLDHTARELDDMRPVPGDLRREDDDATGLLVACEHGHRECVEVLLKHGCPPGGANKAGQTPVMAACFRGHSDILKLVLAARASPCAGSFIDGKGS